MNPYDTYLEKDDKKIKKTYVLYVDVDAKTCDGCDIKKVGVASICTVNGGVECLCEQCIKDILTVWNNDKK